MKPRLMRLAPRLALLAPIFLLCLATTAQGGPQDFTLVNASASNICYVYISPANSSDWEEDVLGVKECLASGESLRVAFSGGKQAKWDLRIEDEDGNYEDYRGFDLSRVSRITIRGNGQAEYR